MLYQVRCLKVAVNSVPNEEDTSIYKSKADLLKTATEIIGAPNISSCKNITIGLLYLIHFRKKQVYFLSLFLRLFFYKNLFINTLQFQNLY